MDPKEIVGRGYDRVSHAYRADDFEAAGNLVYDDWLNRLRRRLGAEARVLELGCGCGIPVARDLADETVMTGVDLSPVQIERARALVPAAEFVCADMTRIDFPADSFDAVIALYSLIHVPIEEQPDLLRRIAAWLRPGGHLLAIVGHTAWTGTEEDWLEVPGGTMFWSHADKETNLTWLGDAGFRIVGTGFVPEGDGGATAVLAER